MLRDTEPNQPLEVPNDRCARLALQIRVGPTVTLELYSAHVCMTRLVGCWVLAVFYHVTCTIPRARGRHSLNWASRGLIHAVPSGQIRSAQVSSRKWGYRGSGERGLQYAARALMTLATPPRSATYSGLAFDVETVTQTCDLHTFDSSTREAVKSWSGAHGPARVRQGRNHHPTAVHQSTRVHGTRAGAREWWVDWS